MIEMGARLYNPTLGRFLEVDPVEGGVDNDYGYPAEPVNQFDLDGRCAVDGRELPNSPGKGWKCIDWLLRNGPRNHVCRAASFLGYRFAFTAFDKLLVDRSPRQAGRAVLGGWGTAATAGASKLPGVLGKFGKVAAALPTGVLATVVDYGACGGVLSKR